MLVWQVNYTTTTSCIWDDNRGRNSYIKPSTVSQTSRHAMSNGVIITSYPIMYNTFYIPLYN